MGIDCSKVTSCFGVSSDTLLNTHYNKKSRELSLE